MKKYLISLLIFYLVSIPMCAIAMQNCDYTQLGRHPEKVLGCYISLPEPITQPWTLIDSKVLDNVAIKTYQLQSLFWPKPEMSHRGINWLHTLTIYQPQRVKFDTALLIINGGTRYHPSLLGANEETYFVTAANLTQSIIVNLQDIPNQYLVFDDGVARKEDGIVAYSWNQYLNDPDQHAYWPVHLPMAKAAIRAMDAVQALTASSPRPIKHFIVSGASKRGWTTWLTAMADERVQAIIPIVMDIFNMQANIAHIHQAYNGWPEAFHDYIEQGLDKRFNSPEFAKLIKIMDPLAYLQCTTCDNYKNRLAIPKYIISASQDEFFPPDSNHYYIGQLPGNNLLRMVPNQGHKINGLILYSTIFNYYVNFLNNIPLPKLQWQEDSNSQLINIKTNSKPYSVKLWQAINPKVRDFRYETGIRYSSQDVTGQCLGQECVYPIAVSAPKVGWKAYFVEVTFSQPENFIATTPGYVLGNNK